MTTQEAIKHLRASLGGLTQEGLARHMNLTVRTIARYENDSPPKGDALKRFVQLADEAGDQEALDAFSRRLRDDFGREAADSIRGFREAISRAREVLSQLKRRDSLSVEQARQIGVEADSILEGLDDEMEDVDIYASAGAWNQPILPGLPVGDDDEKAQAEPMQAEKAPENLVTLADARLHQPIADQPASVHTNAGRDRDQTKANHVVVNSRRKKSAGKK